MTSPRDMFARWSSTQLHNLSLARVTSLRLMTRVPTAGTGSAHLNLARGNFAEVSLSLPACVCFVCGVWCVFHLLWVSVVCAVCG